VTRNDDDDDDDDDNNNNNNNNRVPTSKKTPHFTITKINWLISLKEIISAYSEHNTGHRNPKCRVYGC
jgi:hypothetical protein